MAFNRQQLRRLLATDTTGEKFLVGTNTAASNNTGPTLPEAIDTGADAGKYRDAWMWHVRLTAERRVVLYNQATGDMNGHRPLVSYEIGDVIEVHRFAPTLLHQAINDGLARCTSEQWELITLVANQREYDLSSITYLTTPRQVRGVYVKVGSTEATADLKEVQWARVFWDDGVPTLRIDPGVTAITGYFLYVQLTKRYGPLNDETTTTVAIDEFWARAATKAALYKMLAFRVSPGKERNRYLEDRKLALDDFRRLSKLNQPKFSYRVLTSTPSFGPVHSA